MGGGNKPDVTLTVKNNNTVKILINDYILMSDMKGFKHSVERCIQELQGCLTDLPTKDTNGSVHVYISADFNARK